MRTFITTACAVENSLLWEYTPNESGEVFIDAASLSAGKYDAYFLAKDGYVSLADSFEVTVSSGAGSSFSLNKEKDAFTFEYSTSEPDGTNWIGLYNPGKGPQNGNKVEDSLLWEYTPNESGEVFLDARGLGSGKYDAYFLAKDGYVSLAESFEVTAPTRFIPSNPVTLRNARVGDEYEARVAGLVGGSGVKFTVASVEGGEWASISEDGTITGTPTGAGTTTLTVTASGADASDDLEVHIRVAESGSDLVSELSVMSYNLWHQGTQVNGYHAKQVAFLSEIDVDIVGLQESSSDRTKALADALGWNFHHGNDSVAILSRYPIAEEYGDINRGVGIRVDLGGKEVIHWNVHLGYTPYGPYDFCFEGLSDEEVLKNEASSGRTPQIKNALVQMSEALDGADSVPVLLTGDFNAPSHKDWTEANKDSHCGKTFDWPTSKEPEAAGLIDSLREVHPDPVQDPHNTWSPIFVKNPDYGNKDEPLDRIDFVYHKGQGLTPKEADTLVRGEPKPEPDHKNNEWTSDHKAVIVKFDL
ncbi:hypothetical protein ACO1O0_003682 [Amphichorda felina]